MDRLEYHYKGYTTRMEHSCLDMRLLVAIKELDTKFAISGMRMLEMNMPAKEYVEYCIDMFLCQKRELITNSFNKSFARSQGE